MDDFTFRPLELELGLNDIFSQTAGYHDLESWHINLNSNNHVLTGLHEKVHDQLIYETPYGVAVAAFKSVSQKTKNGSLKREMDSWLSLLVKYSRETHERAATYLSVKTFPIEQHSSLFQLHPPSYQEYYQDLCNLIDTVFQSSYLQYMVASILVEICFTPQLLARLCQWKLGDPIELEEIESPDFRFRILQHYLDKTKMLDLLEYLTGPGFDAIQIRSLPPGFDINTEEHWLGLPSSVSSIVEDIVRVYIRKWFYEKSQTLFPCIVHSNWPNIKQKFVERISQQTGVRILYIPEENRSSSNGDEAYRRIRDNRATIENTYPHPYLKVEQFPADGDPYSEIMLLKDHKKYFISYRQDNSQHIDTPSWMCNLETDMESEEDIVLRKTIVSHAQFKKILGTNQLFASSIGFYAPIDGVLVNPQDFLGWPFAQVYSEIMRYYKLMHEETKYLATDNLFWYMSGSLSSWYSMLKSQGHMKTMLLFLDSKKEHKPDRNIVIPNFNQMSNMEMVNNFKSIESQYSLNIIKSDVIPGYFCRITSVGIPTIAEEVVGDLNSVVFPFEGKEAEIVAAKGMEISRQIFTSWKTF